MNIDSQLLFSDAQSLTGTSAVASTNVLDMATVRKVGMGQTLVAHVTVDTGLAGTSPTWVVAVQTATDAAFTTPVTVGTSATYSGASALPAGTRVVVPLPPDASMLEFVRLSYTMGGTSPTATVTAELQPGNMIDAPYSYPKNYTITG